MTRNEWKQGLLSQFKEEYEQNLEAMLKALKNVDSLDGLINIYDRHNILKVSECYFAIKEVLRLDKEIEKLEKEFISICDQMIDMTF